MLRTLAMAAALVSPAFAVPVAPGISFEHSLVLSSPLSQDAYSALEGQLSTLMTQTNGLQTTAVVMAGSDSRRLQAGSSSTLTITYVVACGSSCDAVAATLSSPDVGFAASIISAINTAASSSGFSDSVVLSTPADVAASISAPGTVTITLPPAPSPPGGGDFTAVAATDFETMGSCTVDGDALSVTQVQGSQLGQCYTPVDATATDTVRIAFDMYCGDGSGADGMCVNLGKNSLDGRVGEDGVAEGVALCFDEWANGGDHGVMMFYNGQTFWEDITSTGNRSGDPPVSYFEDAAWHSVVVDIVPTTGGGANMGFDFDSGTYGAPAQNIASYVLPADVYLGFTGRTGGATNNHWARNIMYAVGATPDVPPAPPTPPAPPPAPPTADGSGGCTFTYYSDAMTVAGAEDACIETGGHLASAHSQGDADAFLGLVANTAWIGYHDMGFEAGCTDDRHQGLGGAIEATSFVWMDGSPSDYENWAGGEPNDWQDGAAMCDGTGNEDCTETWRSGASWNDAACDASLPYICGVCPTHGRNPTIYTFNSDALSKPAAEFQCVIGGGHLASLHSAEDSAALDAMIDDNGGASTWIGYHDRAAEAGCTDDRHQGIGGLIESASFTWTDGTASDYENWADGEPNDWQDGVARCDGTGNEDCTEIWRSGQDWNDAACDGTKPYICGFAGAGGFTGESVNVAAGLPTGNCAFDSTPLTTNHALGGNQAGPNGVRRCGATSSSTVGWGGEPDRAIDGNPSGDWGAGSCTHTDDPGSEIAGTHWWQVDLGQSVAVESVNIYHRTNCCQERLLGATIYVSATADYTAASSSTCGSVDDHLGQPDVTVCNNAAGQFVTVELMNMVITICELEVMAQESGTPVPPPPAVVPPPPPPPPAGAGTCTGTFSIASDNAYALYLNGEYRANVNGGRTNVANCDTATNQFGDPYTGCNWQSVDLHEFSVTGNLVIAVDALDAGGTGGWIGTAVVNDEEFGTNAGDWKCWHGATTAGQDGGWSDVNAGWHGDAPPDGWMNVGYDATAWPSAISLGANGVGPWGDVNREMGGADDGGLGSISASSEWIWSEDADAHNDVYCRFELECGGTATACDNMATNAELDGPESDNGIDGWTSYSATISVVDWDGRSGVISVADAGGFSSLIQTHATEVGVSYDISYDVWADVSDGNTAGQEYCATTDSNGLLDIHDGTEAVNRHGEFKLCPTQPGGAWETVTGTYVAMSEVTTYALHSESALTAYFDRISIVPSDCGGSEPSCTSALTCDELGALYGGAWRTTTNNFLRGSDQVCGESDNGFAEGDNLCFGGSVAGGADTALDAGDGWGHAAYICTAIGARLCTVAELQAEETRGSGCQHDNEWVWASNTCDFLLHEAGYNGQANAQYIPGHMTAVGGNHNGQNRCTDTGECEAGQNPCTCDARCQTDETPEAVRCCADVSADAGPTCARGGYTAGCSELTCDELGAAYGGAWRTTTANARRGSDQVCGESDNGFNEDNTNLCFGGSVAGGADTAHDGWGHAAAICTAIGSRLCTVAELQAEETRGSGCQHDNEWVWAADTCADGHMTAVGGNHNGQNRCTDTGECTAGQNPCTCVARCYANDNVEPAVRCCADVAGPDCGGSAPAISDIVSNGQTADNGLDSNGNCRPGDTGCYTQGLLSTASDLHYYGDRTYIMTEIPDFLNGMGFIRTANDDKRVTEADTEFLCFNVASASTVYVLYDSRASRIPAWLSANFADQHASAALSTDGNLASNGGFEIYYGEFDAGLVCVGGNGNGADGISNADTNYVVVVGPAGVHEVSNSPTPPPPPAADGSGGCTYTIYGDGDGNDSLSMAAAEDACIGLGGHLASAHSQADADAFDTLISGNTAWIGYHDMGFEAGCTDDRHVGVGAGEVLAETFVWTDTTASDYENWASGEPNDWQNGAAMCDGTGNEDCTEAWNSGANWNDANCDDSKPYICGTCPAHNNNPSTYEYRAGPATKTEAEFNCIISGGHLASLHSSDDSELLDALIDENGGASTWIGYHDRAGEAGCTDDRHQGIGGLIEATSFVWTDGTTSDYENWADGEPNDWQDGAARCDGTGNEDCTEIWRSGQDWNDAACDGTKPYICGYPGGPSDAQNMAAGLPTGDCAFDPCVAAGTCPFTTDHAQGGNSAGVNGIRTCGAASSSNVGWGGEPDRAIDGNPNGDWGAGSCTHTDGAGSFANPGTHWWQVDLGQSVTVDSVNIYHRTNCCQERLLGATVYVSGSADYVATGTSCGAVDDHLGQPDVTDCAGAVGQYVTVELTGMIITICELEVIGAPSGGGGGGGGSARGCVTATSGDTTIYDTILPEPLGDDKSVVFTVTAGNDAHLGFFSDTQSTGEVYEIVLSGWGNTMSTIRPCNQCSNSYQGDNADGGRLPTPGLLSATEARTFWATAVDGLVIVGTGDSVGDDEFMRWQDPDHHVASYIGVMTGWGATGEWEVCATGWGGGGSDNAVVTTLASSAAGMTTYQLHTVLPATAANVYALAGTTDQALTMPAAFQVAAPFGVDVGGVNPAFYAVSADAEFDSWLTVGPTDGSAGTGISTIGLGLDAWTADAGISSDNGALFWMNPADGPGGSDPICLAQVTVPTGSPVAASGMLQGRSVSGTDWSVPIVWAA